jgi:hypothetical protein
VGQKASDVKRILKIEEAPPRCATRSSRHEVNDSRTLDVGTALGNPSFAGFPADGCRLGWW